MQRFLEKDIARIKDYDEMIDDGLLSGVKEKDHEFIIFADSFYDNDGNFTDDGISEVGHAVLKRYREKYNYEYDY